MFHIQNRRQRRRFAIFCAGTLSVAALAVAADPPTDPVFAKVRSDIVANIADSKGIACMESVERTRYLPRKATPAATCGDLIGNTTNSPRGLIEWHNRLRLDVTAGSATEEFAFTGATRFERADIMGLLRVAAAGRGEFSSFLKDLIGGDGEPFEPRGLQQTPLGKLLVFGFTVPSAKSHFLYGTDASPNAAHAAYRGALYAVPGSNDLKRLTLEAEGAADSCRVQYAIDYTNTRIGDREIVLPQSSVMDVLDRDGKELHSETYYSSCHRPRAEEAAPASAVTRPLPPGTRFRVRFQVPINGETAATGDPVIGVIRTTVKDKQNGTIVHAGDRLHGRVAAIEEHRLPQRYWDLVIVFETIERGVGDHGIDQGLEQPVSLVPLDDGDRETNDGSLTPAQMQKLRPPNGGYFIFHDANLLVDQKFETEWEIR